MSFGSFGGGCVCKLGARGRGMIEGDAVWTVWDKAEELIKLTLLNDVEGMAVSALYLNFAFDENSLKEKFLAVLAAVFFEGDSHMDHKILW
jgi:hypothetical protein